MSDATWIERKVRDLFSNRDFIGDVIRYTALLEFEVDCLLAQYFLRDDRIDEGLSLLIGSLNFSNKVEILAKLPVRKSVTSFTKAIPGLRRFRRIRNIAAHTWTIPSSEAKNLLNGAEYKKMLVNYPASLREDFIATRNSVERLSRVKDLLGMRGKRTVDSGMRAIMQIMT